MKRKVAYFWGKQNPNLPYALKSDFLEKVYQDFF